MKNLDLDIAYRSGGTLAADLGSIIEQAKSVACRAVDVARVYRNWLLGKRIAKYSILHGSEHLFATKYRLCLPSEEDLRRKIETQKQAFIDRYAGANRANESN